MTIKQKLEVEIMDLPITDEVVDDIGTKLEYVADEFAIGFGVYLDGYLQTTLKTKTIKELLEIYKKEQNDTKE